MLLHHKKIGSGPAVVLLHGYLSSSSYWRDVAADVSRDHTVIAIDLLGFGGSPKPSDATYTAEEQVSAIHATLAHLKVNHFTLVGHSMGAVIAAYYTKTHPEQVTQQLLYMPPIFTSAAQAKREIQSTSLLYRIGLYSPLSRILWPVIKIITARSARFAGEARSPIIHGLSSSTHRSRTLSRSNIIEAISLLELLQKTRRSTHLFVGLHDRAIYQKNLEDASLKLPNTTITYIDDGHHFPIKNPTHIRTQLM